MKASPTPTEQRDIAAHRAKKTTEHTRIKALLLTDWPNSSNVLPPEFNRVISSEDHLRTYLRNPFYLAALREEETNLAEKKLKADLEAAETEKKRAKHEAKAKQEVDAKIARAKAVNDWNKEEAQPLKDALGHVYSALASHGKARAAVTLSEFLNGLILGTYRDYGSVEDFFKEHLTDDEISDLQTHFQEMIRPGNRQFYEGAKVFYQRLKTIHTAFKAPTEEAAAPAAPASEATGSPPEETTRPRPIDELMTGLNFIYSLLTPKVGGLEPAAKIIHQLMNDAFSSIVRNPNESYDNKVKQLSESLETQLYSIIGPPSHFDEMQKIDEAIEQIARNGALQNTLLYEAATFFHNRADASPPPGPGPRP